MDIHSDVKISSFSESRNGSDRIFKFRVEGTTTWIFPDRFLIEGDSAHGISNIEGVSCEDADKILQAMAYNPTEKSLTLSNL